MAFLDITFPAPFIQGTSDELKYNNYVLRTDGGHRGVNQVASVPRMEFKVKTKFTCAEEYDKFYNFFVICLGNVHSFKVPHPIFPKFKNYSIGTGDGSNRNFNIGLRHTFGGYTAFRPLSLFEDLEVNVNGVVVSDTTYTLTKGLIILDTAPNVGDSVTVSGKYFFEMSFVKDSLPSTFTAYNETTSNVTLEEIIYP